MPASVNGRNSRQPRKHYKLSYTVKFCLDLLCFSIVFCSALLHRIIAKPYIRGFFCDDQSLKYPFLEETMPTSVVLMMLSLPCIIIIIVETFHWKFSYDRYEREKPVKVCSTKVHPVVLRYYKEIGIFLFGCFFLLLIVDVAKLKVGRLRPHFHDVCLPSVTEEDCHNLVGYISNYTCLGQDERKILNARKSFPSGHATFASYTATYLAIYLQVRVTWVPNRLFLPFLQWSILNFAWLVSLSRIFDNMHHWSDVVVGIILGTVCAIFVTVFASGLFVHHCRHPTSSMKRVTFTRTDHNISPNEVCFRVRMDGNPFEGDGEVEEQQLSDQAAAESTQ